MSAIGTKIREIRVAKGLTQTALAGNGISSGYVSLIESGKRTPSTAMTKELAVRLGVPAEELLGTGVANCDEARMTVNFARLALASGDPGEAIRTLDGEDLDALPTEVAYDAASVLAEAHTQLGRIETGVTVLDRLVRRCCRDGAWLTYAVASTSLAHMLTQSGDIEAAASIAEQALARVEEAGLVGTDEHIRLGATYVFVLQERGDLVLATRHVEELISVADRMGSLRGRGSVYWNAAILAQTRGRVSDAIRLTDRAVALLGEQSESTDLPRLRLHYAWLLLHQTMPQASEALGQLERAERDAAVSGSALEMGVLATLRGRAMLLLGDVDSASEWSARALQLLGPSDHVDRVQALILLGDIGVARYDRELAHDAYDEARHVLTGMQESRVTARLWRDLGDSLREFDDLPGALSAYDRGLGSVGLAKNPTASRLRVAS
jgi:transcriptional regulator with XRE-family HTH domain